MKRSLLCISLLTAVFCQAQTPSIPPDPDGTSPNVNGFRSNDGQLIGSNGTACPDVRFISEGMYPLAFCQINSVVSFSTLAPGDSLAPDTLERWDMNPAGTLAQQVAPQAVSLKGDVKNYYLPTCGPLGVTGVKAYDGAAYISVYPSIDMYVYAGLNTEKISFVCQPNSTPSNIKLHFTGPSSIQTDSLGGLVFHLTGHPGHFGGAIAYQVSSAGAIISLPWTPTYAITGNDVGFVTGAYNHTLPLVILINGQTSAHMAALGGYSEPGLCWSTYFGGNKEKKSLKAPLMVASTIM